jgi:hypothetical protein
MSILQQGASELEARTFEGIAAHAKLFSGNSQQL